VQAYFQFLKIKLNFKISQKFKLASLKIPVPENLSSILEEIDYDIIILVIHTIKTNQLFQF